MDVIRELILVSFFHCGGYVLIFECYCAPKKSNVKEKENPQKMESCSRSDSRVLKKILKSALEGEKCFTSNF